MTEVWIARSENFGAFSGGDGPPLPVPSPRSGASGFFSIVDGGDPDDGGSDRSISEP